MEFWNYTFELFSKPWLLIISEGPHNDNANFSAPPIYIFMIVCVRFFLRVSVYDAHIIHFYAGRYT